MKTSNKLLLIFFITLVSLMLISDIVLWANFKRGVYGNNLFGNREESYKPRPATTLQPFKIIKIEADSLEQWVNIELAKEYAIRNDGLDSTEAKFYRQEGDTLFIRAIPKGQIFVYCPAFTTLVMNDATQTTVSLFNQDQFTVRAGEKCVVNLSSTKFRSLDLRGGVKSSVVFNYGCEIDTLHMALGKGSDFRSNDVPFKQVDMEMDEWAVFSVDGRSIPAMKQVK